MIERLKFIPAIIACAFLGGMSAAITTTAAAQTLSKIAFRSSRDGNSEIYVMNATDGSNQTNLTNHPSSDQQPAWSPAPAQPVPAISLEGKVTLVLLMLGLTWFALIAERQRSTKLQSE